MPAACGCGVCAEAFGDRAYMALTLRRRPNDAMRLHELLNLAQRMRVATVVTNDVLFHVPARRILQDVVTCIRHNCTIDDAGFRRERHADRYLKAPQRWRDCLAAIRKRWLGRSEIAEPLHVLRWMNWPISIRRKRTMPGLTPQQALEKLTWEGAAERYPEGMPDKVVGKLGPRTAFDRDAPICAVFPDGEFDRPFCPQQRHLMPGPRLCGQQRRLLCAWHHLDRSGAQ